MSVTLISVSHDTVVSNKHEERTRHYYVNFQQNDDDNNDDKLKKISNESEGDQKWILRTKDKAL